VDLLGLTATLVDQPSESHHEGPITDWIETQLRERCPWLQVDRVGNNVVARTQLGRAHRLLIGGHTDTVPANSNVPSRREGNTLYGCGSADMKSGLAVMLQLATTVRDPAVDATYVFYECEEVADEFNGLRTLFAERPDLVQADVALLGEPTSADIEAGCQGTMKLQLTMRGARAHTARPWMGRNAIHRLGAVLRSLEEWPGRRPVLDGCEYREAIQAVRVEGGVAGNVVPDEVTLVINHRFAPDRDVHAAEAFVRELIGPQLDEGDELRVLDFANGAAPGLTHPLLAALISRNSLTVRAKLGWTDVARFAAHGIPAANFGPGDPTLAHTRDECVEGDEIERVYETLEELLTNGA